MCQERFSLYFFDTIAPMISFLRRLDPGLFTTLGLCAFILWPLLSRPGLPNGDDVLYHVYRAAEMDRAWAHGVLMPRWAETFYTGYGAPVFHYYASLTYYLTSVLTRLLGIDAVNSLRLVIALCLFGAGAGMYLFVRRYAGTVGGVLAALVYIYSPYLLFTEPYSRGAYPELLAFALFPFVMWSYRHFIDTGRPVLFALAAFMIGTLIIAHNLMGLVLTGLVMIWVGGAFITQLSHYTPAKRASVSRHILALFALALGIGMVAYFWVPVISEGHAVKLANLTGTAELNYRNFFVPISHLFDSAPRQDAGAFNGLEHQLNLGLAQWTLAVSGLTGTIIVINRQPSRVARRILNLIPVHFLPDPILFFTVLALTFILLITPASAPIWQALAPMAFLQFPWRLLGPAVFCLAVLAGMNAHWLERVPRWLGILLTPGIVIFIISTASPLLYVPEWTHVSVDTSINAYHQQELKGFQRATTFSNEYLPKAVNIEPGATPRLLADYADGYPVNKAHIETLPEGVTVEPLEHSPQQDVWRVSATAPFTIEVLTYDFAGWAAEIDGQKVPITPSDPHGLITFPVPAGVHQVRVYLGSTPARDLGNIVSLISLVMLIGATIMLRHQSSAIGHHRTLRLAPRSSDFAPRPLMLRALIIGGLLSFVFLLLYMREGSAWVNSPPGKALLAQHQIDYHLGDAIHLIGYDLNNTVFSPGDRVELKVYWYTTAVIPYGYSSFAHVSTGGHPLAQADKLNPAGLPTRIWPSSGYIHDDYVIDLPATMPAGEYFLLVGLYTCDTRPAGECGNGERLIVTDSSGQELGDIVALTKLTVE